MEYNPIDQDDYVLVDLALAQPSTASDSYLDLVSNFIDKLSPALRTISLSIHDNPELGYHEYHAHSILTTFLKQQEWAVTPSAYGVGTAFIAQYDSGRAGPVVGFNVEYDALPGIGHACGHNLIAVASLAGAMAAKEVMRREHLGGKVVVFGTPAEEGGGGKIRLLEAGAYKDHNVDVCLISHPGISPDAALVRSAAFTSFRVEYFGKEAHAAAAPWQGINALDALITAYNAISVLRQQTEPGDIIQGNITHGGAKPNIIHGYAAGDFVVRSTTKTRREALKERVDACFQAGALATGAKLITTFQEAYDDHVPNHAIGRSYRRHFNKLGGEIARDCVSSTSASTDQGNISYAMPSLSAGFWIRSEDGKGKQLGGPHTPDFEGAARTEESHERTMRVGKALASTALDVLLDEKLLKDIKAEFEHMKQQQ